MAYDPNNPYANQQQLADLANTNAKSAYQNALSQNLSDTLALEQAKLAWTKTYQSAELSGMFNGAPTWSVDQALGVAPKDAGGGPLLTQQDMYGNSGGSAGGGTNTLRMDELMGIGPGGAPTLGMINSQNQANQAYLDLLSKLQGPANAFQYAKVLAGTPRGLVDIVNAATGRLHIPASGGWNPGGMANNVAAPTGQGGDVLTGPNQSGPIAYGGVPGQGVSTVQGMAHPVSVGADGTLNTTANPNAGNLASPEALVAAANNPSAYQPPTTGALPLPNQIDPTAWARFNPTQKTLMLGAYQNNPNNPLDPADVNDAFQRSLPQYRGAERGGIAGLWQ